MPCLLDKPYIRPIGSVDVGRTTVESRNLPVFTALVRGTLIIPILNKMGEIARILALSGARNRPIPPIPFASLCSSAVSGMVGLMLLRAPDRAKNRAKRGHFTS